MKRLLLSLLCLLPLLAAAQSVPVPADLYFAGLHLRLTDGGRAAIQQKVDAIRRYQPSFQARVNLADAYFPIIDRVFQTEGVPMEFRYLVLQESGLQGEAQSIHDAVGYWQFKRESATELGVLVNDAVDERKHIVASSRAAAKYFLRNNNTFHNWLNTLLSYNLGLTGAKPYALPTDANATEMEISEQTHTYVLTFLAHKVAFETACGQNPKPPMLLQEFPAMAGQQLSAMAASLQTSPEELAKHNRWLLNDGPVPTDKAYTILVPITDPLQLTAMAAQQHAATVGQLLHEPTPDPQNAEFVQVNGLRAIIALPGETKESLAQRAGLKMRRFMQYNDLFAFDNIVVGQPYFVQKKRDKAAVEYHVAQPGESVAIVSQKYGVRAKAIWSKNRMPRNEELRPGRILWLQHTRPKDVAIEYANSSNAAALAAFERAPQPATAAPVPAKPAKKKDKAKDEAEPYTGPTAAASRAVEETGELDKEAANTDKTLVTQADSVTDDHMENLNELPQTAVAPLKPAAQEAPVAQQPPKPLPATAPVADEPQTAEEPVAAAPAPVSAKPAPAPKTASPASAPAAAKTPVPVPAPTSAPLPPAGPAAATTAVEPIPATGLHTVQKGETLYAVARRYALRPADLIAWNNLPASPALRLGQVLRVTAPATVAPANTTGLPTATEVALAAPVRHTVVTGESMYGIARKYGVSVKQVMEWNNKADSNVKLGEVLVINPAK
ncbi:lytic transglycosylase domain-containing protein [Hymenobacter metallicola]|uniref:LysM peptidoglycan-binding domain-containing protein n=1 Tax=Hymenobacter metallicola TaxID=2563114 RepID=A0A4Z0PZX7_9BACT|nr:lytic transglycosylase domain-containing protein [Hymenobacter metallicola]TGE22869.1 LysM peptidoglycan-binding domain-containing protein [Hymenobacter metallicola]